MFWWNLEAKSRSSRHTRNNARLGKLPAARYSSDAHRARSTVALDPRHNRRSETLVRAPAREPLQKQLRLYSDWPKRPHCHGNPLSARDRPSIQAPSRRTQSINMLAFQISSYIPAPSKYSLPRPLLLLTFASSWVYSTFTNKFLVFPWSRTFFTPAKVRRKRNSK